MGAGSGEPPFPSHPSSDPVQGGREPSPSCTREAAGSQRAWRLSRSGVRTPGQAAVTPCITLLVMRRQSRHREGGREKGGQCSLSGALNALGGYGREGNRCEGTLPQIPDTPPAPLGPGSPHSAPLPRTRLLPGPPIGLAPCLCSQGHFVLVI